VAFAIVMFDPSREDRAMRTWNGKIGIESLPAEIQKTLRRRIRNVLERHDASDDVICKVVSALIDEVSWAYAGREHKLDAEGPGHPVSGPANLLSVNVTDLLTKHGLRGNWLHLCDDEEHGTIGAVAELEAIAQTAFREACGDQAAVMARPARISEARKMLGKVYRTKLPDLIMWGPVFEAGPFCVHYITEQ
jgi:hypothetical protein